jgi:hypothetical protein
VHFLAALSAQVGREQMNCSPREYRVCTRLGDRKRLQAFNGSYFFGT